MRNDRKELPALRFPGLTGGAGEELEAVWDGLEPVREELESVLEERLDILRLVTGTDSGSPVAAGRCAIGNALLDAV